MEIKNFWEMKNRKSQIPSTLTWVVAFLVIFFIMLLFIASTSILAEQRTIDIREGSYGHDKIQSARVLVRILNTPNLDEKFTVKELIKNWDNSEGEERTRLRQEIIDTVQRWSISNEGGCYVFSVRNKVQQDIDARLKKEGTSPAAPDSSHSIEFHNLDSVKSEKIPPDSIDYIKGLLLGKTIDIYLVSDKGNIKVSFYVGGCS